MLKARRWQAMHTPAPSRWQRTPSSTRTGSSGRRSAEGESDSVPSHHHPRVRSVFPHWIDVRTVEDGIQIMGAALSRSSLVPVTRYTSGEQAWKENGAGESSEDSSDTTRGSVGVHGRTAHLRRGGAAMNGIALVSDIETWATSNADANGLSGCWIWFVLLISIGRA